MARGAAKEDALGKLHSTLATVFLKVLQKYEGQIDAPSQAEVTAEGVEILVMDGWEPNPAMLSAISKFLKDNDIMFDSEKIDALNSTVARLEERRKVRAAAGVNLSLVPHVAAR